MLEMRESAGVKQVCTLSFERGEIRSAWNISKFCIGTDDIILSFKRYECVCVQTACIIEDAYIHFSISTCCFTVRKGLLSSFICDMCWFTQSFIIHLWLLLVQH